jgi:hypothetical protein
LGRLEQVDPRSVWRHEALNFTPWLLENAARLGEAIGVELELPAPSIRSADTPLI